MITWPETRPAEAMYGRRLAGTIALSNRAGVPFSMRRRLPQSSRARLSFIFLVFYKRSPCTWALRFLVSFISLEFYCAHFIHYYGPRANVVKLHIRIMTVMNIQLQKCSSVVQQTRFPLPERSLRNHWNTLEPTQFFSMISDCVVYRPTTLLLFIFSFEIIWNKLKQWYFEVGYFITVSML